MPNTIDTRAISSVASPFPVSFDGNGALYGAALFVLITVTALSIMLGSQHAQRLWADRKSGKTLAWAFRTLVVCVCTALIVRASPDIVYLIAYGDATEATLQNILVVKRAFDVAALVPILGWMSMLWLYGTEIEFAIKYPAGKVWTDYRLHRMKRFVTVVALAGAFALSVTLGRIFA